jgi:hypothetical protein
MTLALDDEAGRAGAALLAKILRRQLDHKFSVSVENGKSGKRVCRLRGPVIYVVDPTDVEPKVEIYIPIWQFSMKKAKGHRTIIFTSDIDDHNSVKFKTKNIKEAESWYRNINQANEDVRYLQLRQVVHHVQFNRDGSFPVVTMTMTNDGFKFISKSAQVFADIPRAPEISAVPVINDFKKLHVYKNGVVVATLRCEKEEMAREILVILNARPADVETRPQFFLEGDPSNVPKLDDWLFEDAEGSKDQADGEEEQGVEESPLKPPAPAISDAGAPAPAPELRSRVSAASDVGAPVKPHRPSQRMNASQFNQLMDHKKEQLKALPRNEKPPDPAQLIDKITADIARAQGHHPYPDIHVPEELLESDLQPFEFPRICVLESLFADHVNEEIAHVKLTIKTPMKVADVAKTLPPDLRDVLQRLDFRGLTRTTSLYEDAIRKYADLPPDMRARGAAGIFLQGRICLVQRLHDALKTVRFPIRRIHDIVFKHPFRSPEQVVPFFAALFEENLAGFFFRSLEYAPKFRDYPYSPDAFMRVDGFCQEISQYTNYQPPTGKAKGPIPFLDIRAPHVVLAHSIAAFRGQITDQWTVRESSEDLTDERREWGAPLSMIVATVFNLIAPGDPGLGHGKFTGVWTQILKARPRLTPNLASLIDTCEDSDPDRTPVKAVLTFLVNRALPTLLVAILVADQSRTEAKTTEFVLAVAELLKLNSSVQPGIIQGDSLIRYVSVQLCSLFTKPDA